MAKIIVVLKAILTRIIFGAHGLIAIWRVTKIKRDPYYWYLTASVFALGFEGVFTLTIKKNQEWKWFCPSVFFYLCSVVPAIWLIEVDKFDRKLERIRAHAAGNFNYTSVYAAEEIPFPVDGITSNLGVNVNIPKIDAEMWVTVIEQFLMLILIIGRWMLPKGGLTRDQLSQLLLVYIGTAADIIEFFDSFKDDKISEHRVLCLLILSIWSWSLLQFTFVLTATKGRRTRISAAEVKETPKLRIINGIIKVKEVCCNIDVWAILINIILQDAPFLIFRALLIFYYKIISYMNIFFTCKNTLVIILQFYRLYVVQQEKNKELSKMQKAACAKNVANAVERAARIGPQNEGGSGSGGGRARLVKNPSSSKRSGKGPSSKQAQNKNRHRSQESISSQNTQNTNRSSSRRDRNARRRSLSTGNLPEVGEGETFEERIYEDDIELGMSGSALSGTNDPDSQDEEESEVQCDEVSLASERPRGIRKNIRMSENPGIYKISGSRSSGSSERGHGRYRQDTGYSSSSKDSGNSGGRRGRQQHSSSGGRSSGRTSSGNNRSRSTAQRRRQFISSKYCNSVEFGDIEGMLVDTGVAQNNSLLDNERLFQRRAAIGMVFFLFVVIFILCMVAIYGGINPDGLVLRENKRIKKTTRPTTTTPEPSTVIMITNTTPKAHNNNTVLVVAAASVSPKGIEDEDNSTMSINGTLASDDDMDIDIIDDDMDNNDNSLNNSSFDKDRKTGMNVNDDIVTVASVETTDEVGQNEIDTTEDSNINYKSSSRSRNGRHSDFSTHFPFDNRDKESGESESSLGYFEQVSKGFRSEFPARMRHNLRHKFSRIFKYVASDFMDAVARRGGVNVWAMKRGIQF